MVLGILSILGCFKLMFTGINKTVNKVVQVKKNIDQSLNKLAEELEHYQDTATNTQMRTLIKLSKIDLDSVQPSNFFHFDGEFDWDRTPIVYPYSINTIDNHRTAYLAKEDSINGSLYSTNQQKHLLTEITGVNYDENLVIIQTQTDFQLIVIDKANRHNYTSQKALFKDAQENGWSKSDSIIPIDQLYGSYWYRRLD